MFGFCVHASINHIVHHTISCGEKFALIKQNKHFVRYKEAINKLHIRSDFVKEHVLI
jgi:hypothetical protein